MAGAIVVVTAFTATIGVEILSTDIAGAMREAIPIGGAWSADAIGAHVAQAVSIAVVIIAACHTLPADAGVPGGIYVVYTVGVVLTDAADAIGADRCSSVAAGIIGRVTGRTRPV